MENIVKDIKVFNHAVGGLLKYIVWLTKREIAFHKIKPREALFFLTYRCSCRCHTCDMWKREKDYEEMDLDGWKKAVDMVAEQNVTTIYLFGGDVFLKKDILVPLARYISQKGILCDVVMNGNLITKDIAIQLVESGAFNLGVSIDGIGELHDEIRGVKGLFERATAGLRDLLEARGSAEKPNINMYCTISNQNVDRFHEVLPLAIDLGVDNVDFELYGEFTREDAQKSQVNGISGNPYFVRQDESLLLDETQARYLKNKLRELEVAPRGKLNQIETDHIQCLTIDDMVTGEFQHKKCYLIRYHINVDPSGNIIPCLFFQNYHIGNIHDENISSIWGNKKHKAFINKCDNQELPMCKTCIVGIQRNPSFMQALKRRVYEDVINFKRRYTADKKTFKEEYVKD